MKFIIILLLSIIAVFSRYDEQLSEDLYQYSRVAFCSDELINDWSCDACQKNPGTIATKVIKSDLFGIVGYVGYDTDNDRIVAVFRGSVVKINWDLDFTFLTRQHFCEGCKVHTGFLFAWLSVRHDLMQEITLLRSYYPTAQLYVTGHSLGAALSTLAALDLQLNNFDVTALYNYGCPRVGNAQFSQFLDSKIPTAFRVVHNADLFTKLPMRWLGFHHYGQEVWLNENSTIVTVCSPTNSEDPKCSLSIPFRKLTRDDHGTYFFDHIGTCPQ